MIKLFFCEDISISYALDYLEEQINAFVRDELGDIQHEIDTSASSILYDTTHLVVSYTVAVSWCERERQRWRSMQEPMVRERGAT